MHGIKICMAKTDKAGEIDTSVIELATQLETIHTNHSGYCDQYTSSPERIAELKSSGELNGYWAFNGPCAKKATKGDCTSEANTKQNGMKYCMIWDDGEIDTSILELDSIHAWHKGDCYDATGTTPRIKELEKHAKDHGVKVEHGKCKHTNQCKEWRQMKVCRTAPHEHHHGAEEWNGGRMAHGIMKTWKGKISCFQMAGHSIRNLKTDLSMAKLYASHGVTMTEGGCQAAGFNDEMYHNTIGGTTVSTWMH